ncbi:MAG: RimK family alpha-L-glutamate ligase [Suipraeoptans sp.]
MQGLLIYNKDEISINRAFIKMLIDSSERHNIELKVMAYENAVEYLYELRNSGNLDKVKFAINRTRNYMFAKQMEDYKIRVFNSSLIAQIGNDKLHAYQEMDKIGIEYLQLVKSEFSFPYVIKSRAGHGGTQVFMINDIHELDLAKKALKGLPYICQKVASTLGRDLRIYVIGNRIVKAILRSSESDFRSNYGLHGNASVYKLSSEEKALVKKISEYIDADYVGIDFVFDNDKLMFNEIEDVVGARMLYSITDINIAELLIKHISNEIS